ncbi:hypothetical protein A4A49_59697 [Nicotiana attenuata]|nr:hypothetical protein A4A49_64850 [Nicotiana attenuata]OIT34293.1 hypothetical protein A4A49_59697 [Nicotiana attenuata]
MKRSKLALRFLKRLEKNQEIGVYFHVIEASKDKNGVDNYYPLLVRVVCYLKIETKKKKRREALGDEKLIRVEF